MSDSSSRLRVNMVVEGVDRTKVTGGPLCLFQYANGLLDRGHEVRVVSAGPAAAPEWFDLRAPLVVPDDPPLPVALARFARAFAAYRLGRADVEPSIAELDRVAGQLALRGSSPLRRGAWLDRLRRAMPPADVTIATSAPVATPVHVYGTGVKAYFMQHYEAYMVDDFDDPALARAEAHAAMTLPLVRIANSSWLAGHVEERHGGQVPVCANAIDHSVFFPDGSPPDDPFTVVSYGGRGVRGKGCAEAAEAIRLARQEIPGLRWLVYGGASLPPDNGVAAYEDLGSVRGADLRRLYSSSHATLCPSWYESFPLFPIEAMACGSAVVTTPFGTEDYAVDDVNALVVPAREPDAMAAALVRLHREPETRRRLVERGTSDARAFTWERSVARMEELLLETVAAAAEDQSRAVAR